MRSCPHPERARATLRIGGVLLRRCTVPSCNLVIGRMQLGAGDRPPLYDVNARAREELL